MSSRMGYTRLHVSHLSPEPSGKSSTGSLHKVHTKISIKSCRSAIQASVQKFDENATLSKGRHARQTAVELFPGFFGNFSPAYTERRRVPWILHTLTQAFRHRSGLIRRKQQ